MRDHAVQSIKVPSNLKTYGPPLAALALAGVISIFPEQIGNSVSDLPKLINPDVKCEIIMKSPKSGQNTRQFINENKGETPVRTSDLIGMFHIDNPNINAQELKIKGLIYPTQMYRLRRNCSWDYGVYSNLF